MLLRFVILIVLLTVPIIPTFWAILDIPRRRFATRKLKVVWFFVVATLPCIGAILYILFARRRTQPEETP
ncbi:MAG: hypothetical protein GX443_12250 [Deltaproteobacteria bacterium]|nr:hypothetical protein [Deltaproteobacteria bacterium]